MYILAHSMSISYLTTSQWVLTSLWTRMRILRTSMETAKIVDAKQMCKILTLMEKFNLQTNLITKCFGVSISSMIVECFLYSLVFFYTFYELVDGNSTNFSHNLFFNLFYLIADIAIVLSFFIFSSLIKWEENKIYEFFSRKFLHLKDEKALKFSQLALLQLDHQKSELSCGLFEINWKFFFIFVSSIFSNMIVLIQFNLDKRVETRVK